MNTEDTHPDNPKPSVAEETLALVRLVRSAQQLSDEDLRALRLRVDELVLKVLPRLEQAEAAIKSLRPRVETAEELCEGCPLRKAV